MFSTILILKGVEFGKHHIVTSMVKEIFRDKTALPYYVSIYDTAGFDKHTKVTRMLTGIFRNRPALPCSVSIYDRYSNSVLQIFAEMEWIRFKMVQIKNGTIISVTVKSQMSLIKYIFNRPCGYFHIIDFFKITSYILETVKNTTATFYLKLIALKAFSFDERFCSV